MRLILFDLDGVLIDSRENMRFAWEEVQQRHGVTVSFAEYFQHIGRPFRDIMVLLGLEEKYAEIERTYRTASTATMALCRPYPGVDLLLKNLRWARCSKIGIVTSKDAGRTSAIIVQLFTVFDCVSTPRPELRGKPWPDQLVDACEGCGVATSDSVYIGDMPVDAEAAERASCHYAHASWGYGKAPPGADVLDEPRDIMKFLELPA